MITEWLLLVWMLLMVPSESRRLSKSPKPEKTEESELPQDLTDQTETQQNQDREFNPCLETLVVYSDPNDNFFDPDLMQIVMLDVSVYIYFVSHKKYLWSVHLSSFFTFSLETE